MKEKFFKCDCFGEGILLTKFPDESQFYFSYWKEGITPLKFSWWMRLKLCYLVLFKGSHYGDQVILGKEEAEKLSTWVSKRLLEDRIESNRKVLDSNIRQRTQAPESGYGDQ